MTAAPPSQPPSDTATASDPPLVVLVHGACHGAWCWAGLQAELDRRAIPSLAIDRPGHGASTEPFADLHGDADALAAVVRKLDRDVILVGHSYGGAVIGQADTAPHARHLVYVAALVVDEGESASQVMASHPAAEGPAQQLFRRRADGMLEADPAHAPGAFYNRCTPETAAAALARLDPQRAATLKQPATRARWKDVPSTYVLCRHDQAVPPEAQRELARLCGRTVELDADHSPFLCAPEALADAIAEVVAGVAAAPAGTC